MATKIIDGLFLGDLESAHDVDFLVSNKVTHIINCCGKGGNSSGRRSRGGGGPRNAGSGGGYGYNNKPWERIGIKYLVYNWQSSTTFDGSADNVELFSGFIDAALSECTSVLVHSRDGASRACAVVAAYLMRRMLWGVEQMLEYLRVKRHDLNPTLPVRRQLFEAQRRLEEKYAKEDRVLRRLTTPGWNVLEAGMEVHFDTDLPLEMNTIVNTHVNSLQPREVPRPRIGDGSHRLTWIDLQKSGNNKNGFVSGSSSSSSSSSSSRRRGDSSSSRNTKQAPPIRPPGTSYNDLKPGSGWVDTAMSSGSSSSSSSSQRNSYVRYEEGGGSRGRQGGGLAAATASSKYPATNGMIDGGITKLRPCLKSAATRDHDRVGQAAALAEAAALAAENVTSSTSAASPLPLVRKVKTTEDTTSPARWRTDQNTKKKSAIEETTMVVERRVVERGGTRGAGGAESGAAAEVEGARWETTTEATTVTKQWGVPTSVTETNSAEVVANTTTLQVRESALFFFLSSSSTSPSSSLLMVPLFFFPSLISYMFFSAARTSDQATKTTTGNTWNSSGKGAAIEKTWYHRCIYDWNGSRCSVAYWNKPDKSRFEQQNYMA